MTKSASEIVEQYRQDREELARLASGQDAVLVRPPDPPYLVNDWIEEMESWPDSLRSQAYSMTKLATDSGWSERKARWSAYRALSGAFPPQIQSPLPEKNSEDWIAEIRSWPEWLRSKARAWTSAYRREECDPGLSDQDHLRQCSWRAYRALRGRLGSQDDQHSIALLGPQGYAMRSGDRILIIDGPNLAWKIYYATASMRKLDPVHELVESTARAFSGAVNTQAVALSSKFLVVAFDAGDGGRKLVYPEYKANRTHPPGTDEMIDLCMRSVASTGIHTSYAPGFEADDVIATIAKSASSHGLEVIISSNDKDLCQLVGPCIKIYDSKNKMIVDENGVREKFGVPPSAICDYLALVGDQTDNVPGVHGIGPKIAADLLLQHGSLDLVLQAAPAMKGKRAASLVENAEVAKISREVVRLRDVPMGIDFEAMIFQKAPS